MGHFLQDKTTGHLAGSVGDGRDGVPSTPRVLVVPMTDQQAASLQNLAHALHTLKMHPDYADAVDLLVAAADHCDLCGARLGYGTPFNHSTPDGPGHACGPCTAAMDACGLCGMWTAHWATPSTWNDPAVPWPAGVAVLCEHCALMLE